MDIDKLIRRAVTEIKLRWTIPEKGFIAGGAIANLVWEYVSGAKAKVNDIDVFVIGDSSGKTVFEYKEGRITYCKSYSHMFQTLHTDSKYKIHEVTRDGMLNFVTHSQCTPEDVLRSFDINATCVGYVIEDSRPVHLPCFAEFLATGDLRIVNLKTPAHTAIRIAKKSRDMSVTLDTTEFEIVKHALMTSAVDFDRRRFVQRYADLFMSHKDILAGHFVLSGESTYNTEQTLFHLSPLNFVEDKVIPKTTFNLLARDILFFFRHVKGNSSLIQIWTKLLPLFNSSDYVNPEDPETINKATRLVDFITESPNSINTISGLTMDQQLAIFDKVVDKVGSVFGRASALAVIETNKISPEREIDDFEAQLLGLSVRKLVHGPKELPF
jgi:hypothetical protein